MRCAGMAQSVEHVIGNDEVTGPIPVTSSIKETSFVYQDKRGSFIDSTNRVWYNHPGEKNES